MKLVEILKNKEALFIIDDVEDKKTKALVKDINNALISLVQEYEDFLSFAASQLSGEYHEKIVNVKSLQDHYVDWNGIKIAFAAIKREEENKINSLYSNKSALINKLKALMADSQKSLPVIATYHLSNGELVTSRGEHETIILGNHNTNIIIDIIEELERDIVVEGNFDKVEAREIEANYSVVDNNVETCNQRIEELFASKPAKGEKLHSTIDFMIVAAENLVFFETYKQTMLDVGCPTKDVDILEKDLLKKYVPLKKQLQKALKITFEDICNVVVDETEYFNDSSESEDSYEFTQTDESSNNENFFENYSFNEEETYHPSEEAMEEEIFTPIEETIQEEPTTDEINEDPFLDMDSIDIANSAHLEEINEAEVTSDDSLDTIDVDSDLELDE